MHEAYKRWLMSYAKRVVQKRGRGMRLIDADLITDVLKKELARDDCRGFWHSTVNSLITIIEAAPTVRLGDIFEDEEE